MKDVDAENVLLFDLDVKNGIDVPIHLLGALRNRNKLGNATQSIDLFNKFLVLSAQCVFETDKNAETG